MHKQRKKLFFVFFYFFSFFFLFFQGGNFLLPYEPKESKVFYHIFKKGKEMFIYYVFPANNIRHKERKNKKSSSLFLDFIFTCVPTFNPRFWVDYYELIFVSIYDHVCMCTIDLNSSITIPWFRFSIIFFFQLLRDTPNNNIKKKETILMDICI